MPNRVKQRWTERQIKQGKPKYIEVEPEERSSEEWSPRIITNSTTDKKLLIVYNICTITHAVLNIGILNQWKLDIEKLLAQNIKNLNIVVVDCRGEEKSWYSEKHFTTWIKNLKKCGIYYIAIKQYIPMHLSVNYAVKKIIELNGKYEYYMYWSSGLEISNDDKILNNIYNFLENNKNIGRATLVATDDNAEPVVAAQIQYENGYTIKPGFHINEHCSIYSNEWFESFDNRIRPDIFAGNGSEPLFPYMGVSIGKQVIVFSTTFVPPLTHHKRLDSRKNPGISTSGQRWYIKSIGDTVEKTNYLNRADIKRKSNRCDSYNIFVNEHGGITGNTHLSIGEKERLNNMYWSNNLTQIQREELNKIIKEEFFIPNFDYDTIKAEMF